MTMTWQEFICYSVLPASMFMHYLTLMADENSKYQKNRFRKSIECVYKYIMKMNDCAKDGIRFHELKLIYKNKEFAIGIHKKEHTDRYITYQIFINGEEAGMFHQVGDCCNTQYYFEALNKRHKAEVTMIVNAGAKEVKKLAKATAKKKYSWNENSYFK